MQDSCIRVERRRHQASSSTLTEPPNTSWNYSLANHLTQLLPRVLDRTALLDQFCSLLHRTLTAVKRHLSATALQAQVTHSGTLALLLDFPLEAQVVTPWVALEDIPSVGLAAAILSAGLAVVILSVGPAVPSHSEALAVTHTEGFRWAVPDTPLGPSNLLVVATLLLPVKLLSNLQLIWARRPVTPLTVLLL